MSCRGLQRPHPCALDPERVERPVRMAAEDFRGIGLTTLLLPSEVGPRRRTGQLRTAELEAVS